MILDKKTPPGKIQGDKFLIYYLYYYFFLLVIARPPATIASPPPTNGARPPTIPVLARFADLEVVLVTPPVLLFELSLIVRI